MILCTSMGLLALVGSGVDVTLEQHAPQLDGELPANLMHVRPAGEDGVTEVTLGLYVVDILSINDVSESFVGDFFYSLEWRDPRLVEELGLGGTQVALEDIWSPGVTIVNRKSIQSFQAEVADIDNEGTVRFHQRIVGEFTCQLDLREFPFDTQELAVSMTVLGRDADSVRLVPGPVLANTMENISPAGWNVEFVASDMSEVYVANQNRHLPRADHRLRAARIPNYYRLKVFLPLALIVFMAWTVFWIDPKDIGPQVGVSTSSVVRVRSSHAGSALTR